MEAFGFTDLFDAGPARRVLATVSLHSPDQGGRDISGDVPYRPNHNFGDAEDREFFIGQVDVPPEGLRVGEVRLLEITFMNGPGLSEALQVGRRWRIQHGPKWVATAEIVEVRGEV